MEGDIGNIEFMARREDWNFGIALYARQVIEGVNTRVAQSLNLQTIKPGEFAPPFATIDIQAAQQLMDELWQCGLRPTEGTGSAGSLKATENHLNDMRKIAFKGIGIKP